MIISIVIDITALPGDVVGDVQLLALFLQRALNLAEALFILAFKGFSLNICFPDNCS